MIKQKSLSSSSLDSMFKKIAIILILTIAICNETNQLNQYMHILSITKDYDKQLDVFREMNIKETVISTIVENTTKKDLAFDSEFLRILTVNMLLNQFQLDNKSKIVYQTNHINGIHILEKSKAFQDLYAKYNIIFQDIRYFPVPVDILKGESVTYDNSWSMPRTYGGNRIHEGTDLMSSNNLAGYFPVISVSDGVIEQMGWLEQGGYRIGVRSNSGAYFYYAHLDSYQNGLHVGDDILAGSTLGFMGSTGYSKIEGTSGNFDVHLHFGIYLDENGKEISVNPYWILKYLEDYQLYFYSKEKES